MTDDTPTNESGVDIPIAVSAIGSTNQSVLTARLDSGALSGSWICPDAVKRLKLNTYKTDRKAFKSPI